MHGLTRVALLWVALFAAGLLVTGCSAGLLSEDSDPGVAGVSAQGRTGSSATGPVTIQGSAGPGAIYTISVPAGWEHGDLILYARGYVSPDFPVGFTDPAEAALLSELVTALMNSGYAVAYSSFSENGWAVKDGINRTRQLSGIFTSHFGKPQRVYLVGASMGGLVGLALAEQHSELIDGALLLSASIGGAQAQVDYIIDVRVLFNYFFPGIVPGSVFDFPAGWQFDTHVLPAVAGALITDPITAHHLAGIDQIEIPLPYPPTDPAQIAANLNEIVQTVVTAFWFSYYGFDDLLERTHGHIMVDNYETWYADGDTGLPPDYYAPLNEAVQRFTSTPDAEAYLEHWYAPSGRPRVPVVALHKRRDHAVPYFHEELYQELLQPGYAGSFLHVAVDGFGHVESLSAAAILEAFNRLVTLVDDL